MREFEREDLGEFVRLLGEFDLSECTFSDAPDLLHEGAMGVLGVEHTRIYREDPVLPKGRQLLPQERIHGQIVECAKAAFNRVCSCQVHIRVMFSEPSNYKNVAADKVGDLLADAVLARLPCYNGRISQVATLVGEPYDSWHRSAPLPPGVAYFLGEITEQAPSWVPIQSYMVPDLTIDKLAAKIAGKEAKIGQYRSRCTSIWLLMVTDVGSQSSDFAIPASVANHHFATTFDRLFLMRRFGPTLLELLRQQATEVTTLNSWPLFQRFSDQ